MIDEKENNFGFLAWVSALLLLILLLPIIIICMLVFLIKEKGVV
jgi:hypothetical protein